MSTGPTAEAFDAAVRALDRAEKAYNAARDDFHEKLIAAIEGEMTFAEAARRSGYTREHLSKLHAKLTGATGRKLAREVLDTSEGKTEGPARKAMRRHPKTAE